MKAKVIDLILKRVLKMQLYRIDATDGSYCHVWSGGPVVGGTPTLVKP